MLEVLFTKNAPSTMMVKVVVMFEGKVAKADFLTNEEAKLVKKSIKQANFNGEANQFLEIYGGKTKIVIIGLGNPQIDSDIQDVGKFLFKKLAFDEAAYIMSNDENIALNLAYGVLLESYSFDKYKTEKKADDFTKLEQIVLLVNDPEKTTKDFKPYIALVNGVRYCKDLCNEPSNYLTPEVFAADIKRLEYLGLDVEIFDFEQIKLKGLGLIEAVGKGSINLPKVVVVSWKGNRADSTYDLGLVGKGVCFDSDGLSLKSNTGMLEMKMDMTGAAVVVSVMKAVALQRVRKNLVAVVGLIENMPSSNAMKIGDIYASYSGKTVEIMNTDAEGRLVVADCLSYLQKNYKVKRIIDVATLGSLRTVLGNVYAGLFSNDDKLAKQLMKSGDNVCEKLWVMPLDDEYEVMLKSLVADIKNISSDGRASIVSAAFLNRFIEKGQKWAHIDISGVRLDKTGLASGFGVRLLNEFIKGL